jgi:conjugative transfer region protein (TIGR03750 family)
MSEEITFLPARLNGAPIVFRGLTSTELGALAGLAVAVWLPLSLVICAALGFFMMGFGLAGLLALGTVWCASYWIEALKRGKPEGYHLLRFRLLLDDWKVRPSGFIRYSGPWDIRRSRVSLRKRSATSAARQAPPR